MSFDPIKLSPSGAEIYYSGAYADATGATGAGGQYASTASSQGWDTVTFKNAATRVGIGSALPTGDDISTSANYSLAPAVVIGGTTPIGDVRGEGVGYIAQGGSSTIIPLKPNEFYSGALYATYAVGSTAKLTAKVGVGTVSFSNYYQGNFTTRDNYAFDTVLNVDTGNLNATGSGSGVYTIGDTITLQTSLIDRIGDSLNTVSSINDDAFVKGINISILNEDKSIAYSNYKTDYKNPSFTFTKQENIDIFGSFTENFGVKFSVENQDGQTHETDFLLYGNRLSIEKIYVSASGGTYLDENKDNDYGPSTSDIVASDDKLEAVVGFSHRLVNTSGTTGAINFNITFDQDPNFTNYDNLLVFANTGSSTFDTTTQNLLGTFPLSQLQNQNVRIFPDDGIVEGESNFFKFVASSEVGFYNELFTVGPYSIEPVEVGTDPILYNVGEQEIVSGNLSILGQDAGGLYSLGASGSGDGQRLTGPGGLPYLLSGDAAGGGGGGSTGTPNLQEVTESGNITTLPMQAASLTGSNGLNQFKGSTDDANGYVLKTRNYANDDLFNVRNDGHVGIGSLAESSYLTIRSTGAIIQFGTPDGYSIKSEEKAILGVISGNVFSTGSALLGGSGHLISGDYDVIAGGVLGTISGGDYDFIGGGYDLNVNYSEYSVVAGGKTNSIFSGDYSVIGGGLNNLITGIASDSHVDKVAIVGGEGNKVISAPYTFIGAGNSNLISGTNSLYSAILGGGYNQIKESQFATILGGDNNRISFANHSVSAGNYSRVLSGHNGAFVFSDSRTANYDSPRGNTLSLRFQSGVFVDTDSGIYINGNPVMTGASDEDTDTLQSVTDRGATTTNNITLASSLPKLFLQDTDGTNQISEISKAGSYLYFYNRDNVSNGGYLFVGDNGTTDTEFMRIDTAGKVGIGSNAPSAKLDVAGGIKLLDNNYLTWNSSNTRIVGNSSYLQLQVAASDKVRIQSDGHVGIGTNTPRTTLHVSKAGTTEGGIVTIDNPNNSDGSYCGIEFINSTVGYPRSAIFAQRTGGYDAELTFHTSETNQITGSDYPDATERMRIDHDGNVGIGSNNPNANLDVGGSMQVKGEASWAGTDNQNGAIFMDTAGRGLLGAFSTSYARPLITANSNYIDLGSAGTSLINGFRFYAGSSSASPGTYNFYTSGSNNRLHIAKDGKVGIGTDTPQTKLTVGSDGDEDGLEVRESGDLIFKVRPSSSHGYLSLYDSSTNEDIRLNSNGNSWIAGGSLGVGINAPLAKLDVRGTISGSGNFLGTGVESRITAFNGKPYLVSGDEAGATNTLQDVCDNGNTTTTSILSTGPHISGVTGFYSDRVGIGNTHPQDFNAGGNNLVVGSGAGSQGMSVFAGAAHSASLYFAKGTAGADAYRGWVQYRMSNDRLDLGAGGGRRMVIDGNGVGIGTYTVDKQLTVSGNAFKLISTATDANNGQVRLGEGSNSRPILTLGPTNDYDEFQIIDGGYWKIRTRNARDLALGTNNTDAICIKGSTQQVGISTTTPSGELHVYNGASSQSFSTQGDELLVESSDHGGISILTPNAKRGHLYFNNDAFLRWVGDDDKLSINTSASSTTIAIAESAGDTTFGGSVGIGTTNTLTRLVVDAPMFRGGTNPSGMIVTDSANGAMALELGVDRTNSASYIESRHTGSNTSYTLLLNAGYGKVGVGTVSPTSKFEVGTVAYGTNSIAKFWDGTDGVEITNRGGSRQQINFLGSNTSAINASGSLFINYDGDNNGTNDTITFARNGADENGTVDMVIKEGDVGIGTNSPISQFHITGASPVLTLNSPSSDFSRIDFVRGTTAAKWDINHTAAGDLKFRENTYTKLTLYRGNGRVGIGSEIPAYTLDVAGDIQAKDSAVIAGLGASDGYIFHDFGVGWGYKGVTSSSRLGIFTDAAERLTIDSAGRVGIGSTNPGHYKLEVIGDISGSGSFFGTGDGGRITNNHIPYLLSGDEAGATNTLQDVTNNGNTTTNAIIIENTGGATDYAPLTVSGALNGTQALFRGTGIHSFIQFQNSTTNYGGMSSDGLTIGNNGADAYVTQREAANLYLMTNNEVAITIDSERRVGMGTLTPKTILDVDGAVNHGIRIGSNNALIGEGGGTTGTQLIFWNGTSAYYGRNIAPFTHTVSNHYFRVGGSDKMAITSAGVGIGSASPAYVLDTVFAGDNGARIRSTDDHATLRIQSDASHGGYIRFTDADNRYWIHNDTNDSLYFRPKAVAPSSNVVVVFDETGRVGIGTSNPDTRLHVKGTAIRFEEAGGSTRHFDIIPATAGVNHKFTSDSTSAGYEFYNNANSLLNLTNTEATFNTSGENIDFRVKSSGSTAIFVDASIGTVGINQSSPSSTYALDVGGSIRMATAAPSLVLRETDSSNQEFSVFGLGGDFFIRDITQSTYPLKIEAGVANDTLVLESGGSVGIGTNSPARKLEVSESSSSIVSQFKSTAGTSAYITLANTTSTADKIRVGSIGNDLILSSNYTDPNIYIKAGGNVGIGTDSPSETLHVFGTTRLGGRGYTGGASIEYASFSETNGGASTIVGNAVYAGNSNNTYRKTRSDDGNFIALNYNKGITFHTHVTGSASSTEHDINNHEQMRLTTGGLLGVGTDAPESKLHVAGDIRVDNARSILGETNGGGNFQMVKIDTSDNMLIGDGNLVIDINGTSERMKINSAGNVLIGQPTDTVDKLMVQGEANLYAARFNGSTNGGESFGVRIRAGTTANDISFLAENTAGADLFKVDGVGDVTGAGNFYGTGAGSRITNDGTPYLLSGDAAAALTLQDVCDNGNTTTTSIVSTGPHISGTTGLFENAKISNFNSSDYAAFGHENVADDSYAIRQHSNGNVHINCGSSRLIQFRHQNSTQGGFNAAKDFFVGPSETNNTFHVDISETNVGVGTYAPLGKLTVATTMSSSPTTQLYLDVDGSNTVGGGGEVIFNTSASAGALDAFNAIVRGQRSSLNDGSSDLTFLTTHVPTSATAAARMTIKDDGKVGIGTISPSYELDVIGTTRSTYYIGGAYFEENASSSKIKFYPNGTILVLDEDGQLKPSEKENDTLVFGVSKRDFEQPIVLGAEPILITGPIEVGDYIVTSNKQGHGQAMKENKFGTVIAQAMEKGDGESYNIKAMIRKM